MADIDPQFAHRTRTNIREEPLSVTRLLQYLSNPEPETDANPEDTP